MRAFIGIDTSCYTTSLAAVDENGSLISFHRRLLPVNKGARGLRQSEAVFLHLKQFPVLYDCLMKDLDSYQLSAVCVSSKPSGSDSSYMPVFTVGLNFAKIISSSLGIKLYESNHQLGHFSAAKIGLDFNFENFIGVHLSGGTTDFLKISGGRNVFKLASSNDLHAGQLIDRMGVKLGLGFPSGAELEKIAKLGKSTASYKSSVFENFCSLSGIEARALNDINGNTRTKEDIACEVFDALSRTVLKQLAYVNKEKLPVLITGGVASSELLRNMILERNSKRFDFEIFFGDKKYSGDNAAGIAVIGLNCFKEEFL